MYCKVLDAFYPESFWTSIVIQLQLFQITMEVIIGKPKGNQIHCIYCIDNGQVLVRATSLLTTPQTLVFNLICLPYHCIYCSIFPFWASGPGVYGNGNNV